MKDLRSQLSGWQIETLFNCCVDDKYMKFLKYVRRRESTGGYSISNIGTILERVPRYSNYEQLFSAGIDEIVDNYFTYTISDIPKGLIKLCRDRQIKISNRFLQYYNENPDGYLLAYNLDYTSLTDSDIWNILSCENYAFDRDTHRNTYWSYFNKLLNEYGYTAKSLMLYIDMLKTFEAIEDMSYLVKEIYDYAKMMKTISHKFDKYPRNFLTTHKIACRNYNRLKKEFSEEIFKHRIMKAYECKFGDYVFIYPKTTQEIKDESVQQNNCVSSYIDKVIDGNCHILFLRKVDSPDKSLVTIEIRNNRIVQAKRKFNDPVTNEDQKAIDYWNHKYSNIEKENAA